MVEIQLGARQLLVAVLAGVAVAGEDVEAREADVALGYALIGGQQQDARDADDAVHDAEALVLDLNGQIAPTVEVKRVILLIDRLGYALIKQRKRAFYRRNVNGEVRAIENEDLAVEQARSRETGRNHVGRSRHPHDEYRPTDSMSR